MEFPFDVNHLFSERISVLDHNFVAGPKFLGRADLQTHIATVIDDLGRASAKAQTLSAPVTSASKLQSQKHQLYVLKDGEGSRNRGREVVVGFLKVGYKKLFLLDRHGVHVEAEPLCVLDFYIVESLQRHGFGLELFGFMLQHKNLEPVLMAYDRPSPRLLSFLAKHYCLMQSVPQVNNFVVFDGFFLNKAAVQLRKAPLKKPDGEIKPYSLMEREVVRKEQRTLPWPFAPPHSPQRSVSSRPGSVESSPSRVPPPVTQPPSPGSNKGLSAQSPVIRARHSSQRGLAARSSLYSRHMDGSSAGQLDSALPVGSGVVLPGSSALRPYVFQPLGAPPLSAGEGKGRCSQTPAASRDRLLDPAEPSPSGQQSSGGAGRPGVLDVERPRRGPGCWWTLGESCSSAQWVKQKQGYRSTRPW
ncbi:alpha-tubulin N-acetyltransferase 1 isoform 3-T3 [Menidia menidia]